MRLLGRVRAVPAAFRAQAARAFVARSALLAISAARAFAATLLALPVASTDNDDRPPPPHVSEVLAEARYCTPRPASREPPAGLNRRR